MKRLDPHDRLPDRPALAVGETALLELPFKKRIDAMQHRGLGHPVPHSKRLRGAHAKPSHKLPDQ